MTRRAAHRRHPPFPPLIIAMVLSLVLAFVALILIWIWGSGGSPRSAVPVASSALPAPVTPTPGATPSPRSPDSAAAALSQPIDPKFDAFTTFRGNWTRTFQGEGPVPVHPEIAWKVGPWCAESKDMGKTERWCGTGWNGTPNVIPRTGGGVEIRVGGYDDDYHFLDGATGRPVRPAFPTGDLAKGSATSDPDGYPLYYAGSRDNFFRIIALDRPTPTELWSMNAETSVPDPRWNNDWDGAAQIVGDYLLEGGENSWFYVVKLNRHYDANHLVQVNPKIVFRAPGWDEQLLAQDRGVGQSSSDISIEDSIAYDAKRKVAYFGNSGGLVQGWDISRLLHGGTKATRVFRFWTGGENDASIVIDAEGMLYVSDHYDPPDPRAEQVGQLVKLDPTKPNHPVIWSLKESTVSDGGAGFFSTPALVGNTLYASANGGDLMAIDAKTGKVFWRHRLAPPLWSGPVVVGGRLVIGDCSGTLYGFDVSKRRRPPRELWKLPLGGCIETTPAVWRGMIYLGTRAGYEYGIRDRHPLRLKRQYERQTRG